MPETYSIREAADACQMSYEAMRARVDRGVVRAVKRDGVRRIPRSELEHAGLWPGSVADSEDPDGLRAENERLRQELQELRLLPERIEGEWRGRVEAEHEARRRAEAAVQEAGAQRAEAESRVQQAEAQVRLLLTSEREAQREIGRLEERLRHRSPAEVRRRLRLLLRR